MRTERAVDEMRTISIERGYSPYSVSIVYKVGKTIVHCSATVSDKVPGFLEEGSGWITAEYAMLPGSTSTRVRRDRGKVGGRTLEIQRLIGRSLRSVADLKALGSRSIYLDCDVLSADGGTRCASISGAYIALHMLLQQLESEGQLKVKDVLTKELAAISVGIVDGELLLDLEYKEDSCADVDLNLVMTVDGHFVEIQGTAERDPFSREQLNELLSVGEKGITTLIQKARGFLQEQNNR